MAEVKWIKIMTDIFDNRKIRQIEKLPDSDAIIIIWFKILCLAGNLNENGLITLTADVPYTDEMLANEFNKPINTVRLALEIFQKFKMIEIINDIYCVSNWEKYQNVDGLEKIREQTRKRVAQHRERHKQLALAKSNVTCNVTVTQSNATDIEEEKDKEKEVEIDDTQKIINCYEENIGMITPASAELLLSYLDTFNQEIICTAIKKSATANKRSTDYICGILKDWQKKNIKTMTDITKEEEDFKAKNKGKNSNAMEEFLNG